MVGAGGRTKCDCRALFASSQLVFSGATSRVDHNHEIYWLCCGSDMLQCDHGCRTIKLSGQQHTVDLWLPTGRRLGRRESTLMSSNNPQDRLQPTAFLGTSCTSRRREPRFLVRHPFQRADLVNFPTQMQDVALCAPVLTDLPALFLSDTRTVRARCSDKTPLLLQLTLPRSQRRRTSPLGCSIGRNDRIAL
jgi:hypothetical protein